MSNIYQGNDNSILFFETRSSSFERFPLWLSQSIIKLYPEIELNFLSVEKFSNSQKNRINKSLINDVRYLCVKSPLVKSFTKALLRTRPTVVVLFAHRLPDVALLVACRNLSIKTVYYQHGLYIPFMKRELSIFFHNSIKTLSYALYAISIGRNIGVGAFKGLLANFRIFIFGKNIYHVGLPLDLITADICLVYGQYWVDYHRDEYGYDPKSIRIVGTPDLSGIDLDSHESMPYAGTRCSLCYIAQTLVEDGRLQRETMMQFLTVLASVIKKFNAQLVIKLHPRSDLSLYEDLNCDIDLTDDFPAANAYIGHYSTVLVRGVAFTEKFLLINFPGHNIPEYINLLATKHIDYMDYKKLFSYVYEALNSNIDSRLMCVKRQKIKPYFHSNHEEPFHRAARSILSAWRKTS